MKRSSSVLVGIALAVSCATLTAHEVDPGGRVVVTCPASGAPRMANVARAIEESHYWASQATRREMLVLARAACADGSRTVTFVPPIDQRYAAGVEGSVAQR